MPAATARASTTGQPTVAVLGTARNDFVIAAARALRDTEARVTVLVRRGREEDFLRDGLPVRTFTGRITWYNLPVLAALRGIGATRIAVVAGDHFSQANVVTALNWWRAAGLLRGADVYVSSSTQPAVLECYNTVDQRQRLAATAATGLVVVLAFQYPVVTVLAAVAAGGLELATRRWHRDEHPAHRPPSWPVLVDDPRLGWRLRPVNIIARVTTIDTPPRTIRVTVDTRGQRATGAALLEHDSRPAVAFYGGSYVFGDSLSDEETIPWHTATLLTQHRVLNRAVPGYGACQALTRLLDDLQDDPPAAAVVIVPGNGPAQLPASGHARFPLTEHVAVWRWSERVLGRWRARRGRRRALRAVTARCARQGIPLIVHWTPIGDGASHESVAALLAQDVRGALEHSRRP